MLLLTRRIGEKLLIGDNVVVTVLGVNGNQVRLGIGAPAEVTILREEIAAHDVGPGDRKKPSPSIRKRMPE